MFNFSPKAQQPPVGQRGLVIEASRSHSDIPQLAGLLWTISASERPLTYFLDGAGPVIGNMFHIGGKNSCNNNILTLTSATSSL